MLEIYVDQISERLIYTLDYIFLERGLKYKLNNDFYSFQHSSNKKINYSEREFDDVPQLVPSSVLFDEAVFSYALGQGLFHEEICLTFNRILDPLASVFFILTRMEEYTDTRKDEHDRFVTKNSILFQYGWLNKAVCDRWAVDFLAFLTKQIGLIVDYSSFPVEIFPSFDIDNAYAYLHKNGWRRWLSTGRDYFNRNNVRIKERKAVRKGMLKDPYDTFDEIEAIRKQGFQVFIFWLLGDYGPFDKNLSYKNIGQREIVQRFRTSEYNVGIHPSYNSNSYHVTVETEVERLNSILYSEIVHSRQHFLKLNVSKTYPTLIRSGILHDYTMGFADQVGFRAGTARPFKWFDLTMNVKTNLTIHPFVYMDGTLNEYLKLGPEESKVCIQALYDEICKFGGDFFFIWHNETIGNYGKWDGWKEVLDFTLNLGKQR